MKYKPFKEPKVWSLAYADKKFSYYIRKRDGVCQRCKKEDGKQLECSHYWDRQWYSTRFDPDNCCALHTYCHVFDKDCWEKDRNKEYEAYMRHKLGNKGYNALKDKHLTPKKKRQAIIEVMELLKKTA